jgi:hypothetical protein
MTDALLTHAQAASEAVSGQPKHICAPHEVVPEALCTYLRWDERHDAAAEAVMQEYGLRLPEHRELIRQLAVSRVLWGRPDWR